jgi:hypothetical protein
VYDARGYFLGMAMQAHPQTQLGRRIANAQDKLATEQEAVKVALSFGAMSQYSADWWQLAKPSLVSIGRLSSIPFATVNLSYSVLS